MNKLNFVFLFILLVFFLLEGFAQKNAQWRGTQRDGIYNEKQLMKKWPEKGPELKWLAEEIGCGFAAPVITEDKIFIMGEADSTSLLYVFDLNGKLIWKAPNGKEFYGQGYANNFPGARSTPTVVNDLVYISSGKGRIACLEVAAGKEKWARDMVKDLGGWENEFGYSESLLVDDKNVYCFPGGTTTNIAAFDRFTGKTVWVSKALGDTTSFCSPILITLPTRKIFVSISRHYIFGIDTQNGELLWSQKLENFKYDGEHCNTPIYSDGFIYYIAGDENGNGVVKLELSGDGKNIKEVWRNNTILNGFGGFVVIGNNLIVTTNDQNLKSVDLSTGKVITSLHTGKGSIIYADDLIYCYGEKGEMLLIKYAESKFEIISKFKVEKGTKEHFSHPVIANGILYIRHGKALMAYDIKAETK